MLNERLKTIAENAGGSFAYLHFALFVYGAANDDPTIILLGIASLIIGSLLGREPKKRPANRRRLRRHFPIAYPRNTQVLSPQRSVLKNSPQH
ncbi:MAG TPA: hypothetical protein VM680_03800 [Verrucomicrobiae bacterium]|nr:hypothetical protein [Verrucomicrobiae bacterium]